MKYTLKGYFEPTPPNIRKLADSILVATQSGAIMTLAENNHTLTITLMVVGVVCKFASNFFTEA